MKFAVVTLIAAFMALVEAELPHFTLRCSDGDKNIARSVCNNLCYASNFIQRYKDRNYIYTYNSVGLHRLRALTNFHALL